MTANEIEAGKPGISETTRLDEGLRGIRFADHTIHGADENRRPLSARVRYDGAALTIFHGDVPSLTYPTVLSPPQLRAVLQRMERYREDFLKPYTSLESSVASAVEIGRLHGALAMEPASPILVAEAVRSLLVRHFDQFRTDWRPVNVSIADCQPTFGERSSATIAAWSGFSRVVSDRVEDGRLSELEREFTEARTAYASRAEQAAGAQVLTACLGPTNLMDDVFASTERERLRLVLPAAVTISVGDSRPVFTAVLHIQGRRDSPGVEFECQVDELTTRPVPNLSDFLRRLRDASAKGISEPRWGSLSLLDVDPPLASR